MEGLAESFAVSEIQKYNDGKNQNTKHYYSKKNMKNKKTCNRKNKKTKK